MTSIYEQFYIVFQMDIHGIDAPMSWMGIGIALIWYVQKKIQLKYNTHNGTILYMYVECSTIKAIAHRMT